MSGKKHPYKIVEKNSKENNLIFDYFMPSFRKGYIELENDKYVMPVFYLKFEDNINNFEIKNSDVFVVSHPKTGTTWTQEMVWMIANNLDFEEGAKVFLPDRFPFLEVTTLFDFTDLMQENKEFNPPEALTDSFGFTGKLKDPRFIKTHLPWSLLPNQIQSEEKKPKIIYVVRNPKDTCVSYFHHCRVIEGYTGSFEDFAELFLAGKISYGPYWKHVLSFWERRNKDHILFISYEQLKRDLPQMIKKVAEFLGKTLTDEQIQLLTKHLSFESMKANPSVNYEFILDLNEKFNLTAYTGKFMRSGKVGSYKAEMTPELITKFDAWTEKCIAGTDFPINDLF